MPRAQPHSPLESAELPGPIDELPLWRRPSVRHIGYGLAALATVYCLGVVGYLVQGWDVLDATYMVAITISTTGFTEVRPLATPALRIHTMAIIGLGTLSVAYLVGACLQLVTEGEILRLLGSRDLRRRLLMLDHHAIIVGFGRMGSLVCEELAAAHVPFVVIEQDAHLIAELQRRRFPYVHGNATEESVLAEAGLLRARALVTAVASDADSVFITLTARQLAPRVAIIARAEMPSSQKKLLQAGANHVVLTAAIGARRISGLIRNPNTVEFVELITRQSHLDLEVEEIPIRRGDALDAQSLRHADIGHRTGVMVIAVKRSDARVEFPPTGDEPLSPGDTLVVLGRRANLDQFRQAFFPDPAGPRPLSR